MRTDPPQFVKTFGRVKVVEVKDEYPKSITLSEASFWPAP
jgi:hypothetical protein